MMDKYGYKIPIDSLRAYILRWLGLSTIRSEIASACVEAKKFSDERVGTAVDEIRGHIVRVGSESLYRDQSNLDQIRLNHESILNTVKQIAESHVNEHIAKLSSAPQRHVSCPRCGNGFDLATLGIHFSARSATIICDKCQAHFEVRPSLFWDKIEVEVR